MAPESEIRKSMATTKMLTKTLLSMSPEPISCIASLILCAIYVTRYTLLTHCTRYDTIRYNTKADTMMTMSTKEAGGSQ